MTTTGTSNALPSTEPVTTASTSIVTDVDKSNTTTTATTAPPPPPLLLSTEAIPEEPPQSPSRTRRESHISEIDPNAFKVTILLASSGYRTQISVNRSFLEKASFGEGDEFLVSQLKNAIWKDWPSGTFHIDGVSLIRSRLA